MWVFLVGVLFENSIVCQVFYVLNSSPTNVLFVGGFFLLISLSTIIFFELVFSGSSCFFGEFDPGSGRTLAACLTHASRTKIPSLLG